MLIIVKVFVYKLKISFISLLTIWIEHYIDNWKKQWKKITADFRSFTKNEFKRGILSCSTLEILL